MTAYRRLAKDSDRLLRQHKFGALVLRTSLGVMTTGPKGAAPSVSGSQEVAVVDAGTGQILDFAVDGSSLQLPGGTVLYSRG